MVVAYKWGETKLLVIGQVLRIKPGTWVVDASLLLYCMMASEPSLLVLQFQLQEAEYFHSALEVPCGIRVGVLQCVWGQEERTVQERAPEPAQVQEFGDVGLASDQGVPPENPGGRSGTA